MALREVPAHLREVDLEPFALGDLAVAPDEAARLDGANAVQLFLRITFPLLSPTIFFVLVIFMIGAIQVFDTIIVLTGGGPGDASKSVVIYIYEQAFQNFDLGYASTVAMTLFVIILIFTLLQFWFSRRWVHYE